MASGKKCTKCKEEKPISEFGKNKIFSDNLHIYCRSCCKGIREKRKQQQQEYDKKNYLQNKKQINQRNRAWYDANKEKHHAYMESWRSENKEQMSETSKRWRQANMGTVIHHSNRRRLSEKRAMPGWADEDKIKQVYAEAHQINKDGGQVHVDHIVPINSDIVCGLHCEDNLQIIPAMENLIKSNKI